MLGKTHFSAFHSYGYLRSPKKSSALNRQLACAGWLTGLAHGGFLREVTSETPIAVATLETEFPVRFRYLFCPNHHDLRRSA
jgi:hypothetical protein